jgi:Flp pilus assembly protein TadB
MDAGTLTQSPFTVVTFIAAPALLTNASSVLAMSTTNRMLRTRESMRELLAQSEKHALDEQEAARVVEHVNRVEAQAGLLLKALHTIYLALGAFAAATLVTLVGAALPFIQAVRLLAALGLTMGAIGVGCLIVGSLRLFQATQISLINIREEAVIIRARYRKKG